MKQYLAITFLLLPICAQPDPMPGKTMSGKTNSAKTAATKTAKSAPKPAVVSSGLPAAAVEVGPGLYQLADKTGKMWFYRRTPFGVSRFEEPKQMAALDPKLAAQIPSTQVSEQGDSLKFVRPGPFGNYTWVKKKTELDESEQAAYQAFQVASTAPTSGDASSKMEKVEKNSAQPTSHQNKGE